MQKVSLMSPRVLPINQNNRSQPSMIMNFSLNAGQEPAEKVFYFLKNLDKYYLQISPGHRSFNIINTPNLQLGSIIENEEVAGGQTVRHRYTVVEVQENKYLKLVSERSIARACCGCLNIPVKTTVEFNIDKDKSNNTMVSARLTLEYNGSFTKFWASLTGTQGIWQRHLQEEMENSLKIIRSSAFSQKYLADGAK